MAKYVVKRLILLIPIVLGITFIIFTIMDLTPGDPARLILGPDATAEAVEQLTEEMGLNRPFLPASSTILSRPSRGWILAIPTGQRSRSLTRSSAASRSA